MNNLRGLANQGEISFISEKSEWLSYACKKETVGEIMEARERIDTFETAAIVQNAWSLYAKNILDMMSLKE